LPANAPHSSQLKLLAHTPHPSCQQITATGTFYGSPRGVSPGAPRLKFKPSHCTAASWRASKGAAATQLAGCTKHYAVRTQRYQTVTTAAVTDSAALGNEQLAGAAAAVAGHGRPQIRQQSPLNPQQATARTAPSCCSSMLDCYWAPPTPPLLGSQKNNSAMRSTARYTSRQPHQSS